MSPRGISSTAPNLGCRSGFLRFKSLSLRVSENFNPIYALSWQADELLAALRTERGADAGEQIGKMPLKRSSPYSGTSLRRRKDASWNEFFQLSQPAQERLAAGFELIARKT